MTDALEERDGRWGGFVDGPALEDYAARYADHFVIQRNEGVVEVSTYRNAEMGPPSPCPGRLPRHQEPHGCPPCPYQMKGLCRHVRFQMRPGFSYQTHWNRPCISQGSRRSLRI